MFENAFIGHTAKPTETELSEALGAAKAPWDQLLKDLGTEFNANGHEWKSYSPKAGWALRVLRQKRTIVWCSPGRDGFEVSFILGEKAMRAAREAKLPKTVARALETAPKYPEGTGVRLFVESPLALGGLKQLAAIKVKH
jgi:hypothetical protein